MSQTSRLEQLLIDGLPHRTDEIMIRIYGAAHLGVARIGARIADLKDRGYQITSWPDKEQKTLWWYQIVKTPQNLPYSELSGKDGSNQVKQKISLQRAENLSKKAIVELGLNQKFKEKQMELFG